MTETLGFIPLVGRAHEVRELQLSICERRLPALAITGPSGIGKTAIVDHFVLMARDLHLPFERVWSHSLYRTSWTSALADLRKHLEWVPRNATIKEIEDLVLDSCSSVPTLLVLDNVDEGNVDDLAGFLERWAATITSSSLIVTAQPHVAELLPTAIPSLRLEGIRNDAAILDISGSLSERFSERTVLEVGRLVGGNPQRLLFLNWLQPETDERLRELASNLESEEDNVTVEEFVESTQIPGLFLLALGVHKNLVVAERLLGRLWDHFGAGGAAEYVRVRALLISKKILLPATENAFRLHESVHVSLEKALIHRVGKAGIPHFHHHFAEYYAGALREEVSTTNLTNFIYHSLAAKNYSLALRPFVEGALAQELATRGSAVLVRQEMEKLYTPACLQNASPLDEIKICLRLGAVCNDLSDHSATLTYMKRASLLLEQHSLEDDSLRRQIWYQNAVSYSNIGQSTKCLREYFKIVDSCPDPQDDLSCLSLGYLAHDLKYRDLETALELGKVAVDWASECQLSSVLAKNMCSYAESMVIAGQSTEAVELFHSAMELAMLQEGWREVGRIATNLGFALTRIGDPAAESYLSQGKERSSAMGDRRRMTQAILYTGVWQYLSGGAEYGKRMIAQAADLLRILADGRYFIPALCWTLLLEGYNPRSYPTTKDRGAVDILTRLGYPNLLIHAENHPEFQVYHRFWWRYLSEMLGG